jgi:multidrug efflux pump subunit AcrA (membrane-fusion protein)
MSATLSRTASLYTDENYTHFNTLNGVVPVPQPLQLGSVEWKQAQLTQKKIEAAANNEELTPAQLKRIKKGIEKAARSYNDKRLAEEKLAEEAAQAELLRKQRRKDAKKLRAQLAKQEKTAEKQAALDQEAETLYEQCKTLGLDILVSPSVTSECVIEICQNALTEYMNRPLTKEEFQLREDIEAKQKENIYADARACEIFRDAQTNLVAADQRVEGEEVTFSMKKKKNKKKKLKNSPPPKVENTPEFTIDWGDEPLMGRVPLTKKQQREIAYNNCNSANSA